jgi:hypothetical protein
MSLSPGEVDFTFTHTEAEFEEVTLTRRRAGGNTCMGDQTRVALITHIRLLGGCSAFRHQQIKLH